MNQLKTDYVDAVFSGNRKYTEIANADDTVSFTDETAYTQTGDKFGATDINATNGAINKMARTKTATLPANGWTGSSAPYYNTVMISGISSTDSPIVSLYLANNRLRQIPRRYARRGLLSITLLHRIPESALMQIRNQQLTCR